MELWMSNEMAKSPKTPMQLSITTHIYLVQIKSPHHILKFQRTQVNLEPAERILWNIMTCKLPSDFTEAYHMKLRHYSSYHGRNSSN